MIETHSRARYVTYSAVAVTVVAVLIVLALMSYRGSFQSTTTVYLQAPRAGLMLQPGSDVKMDGVVIGRVQQVDLTDDRAKITMALQSSIASDLPVNVHADLEPTTLFGRKFVSFSKPSEPQQSHLTDGTVIDTSTSPVEVNDTLALLLTVLKQAEPEKISATLTALGDGTRDRGAKFGTLITDVNSYLAQFNQSLPVLRRDLRLGADNLSTLADLSPDLMATITNLTVTSKSIVDKQSQLSAFILSFTNLGNTGTRFLAPTARPLVMAADSLAPVSQVLGDYAPIYPCFLNALNTGRKYLEQGLGGARPGLNVLGTLLLGNPPYRAGTDAPKNNAGSSGPSCYGYPFSKSSPMPGHYDFDDGSHAYRRVQGPEDILGNPFASLIYGMTK
ncbi:MCE family protein [Gordonia sp. TBRC 11910]|uniref:MCE family protein n=1 Tax=Gordonia asplenii TaxID=2725283 RepID=A0A848L9Z1_9ACTN|nr:MCE family protein [Gordonia asplenii]NMO05271.1 MCE family protein [Gordonia asplenii]